MGSHVSLRRYLTGLAFAGVALVAAGCQSSDSGSVLKVGDQASPPPGKVLESELRAYCPSITLREGTAFYSTYAKGAKDDPSKLAYQAAMTDVTRSCSQANGMMTINVAAAGKIVTGPSGAAGTITLPIRVAVIRGEDEVLYSQLSKYQVSIADTSAATQFVFNDPNIAIPTPAANTVRVFVGYDEGPEAGKKK